MRRAILDGERISAAMTGLFSTPPSPLRLAGPRKSLVTSLFATSSEGRHGEGNVTFGYLSTLNTRAKRFNFLLITFRPNLRETAFMLVRAASVVERLEDFLR